MTDERIEFIAQTREKLDLLNAKILDLESKAYEKKAPRSRNSSQL